jgi:hypothetical protein
VKEEAGSRRRRKRRRRRRRRRKVIDKTCKEEEESSHLSHRGVLGKGIAAESTRCCRKTPAGVSKQCI